MVSLPQQRRCMHADMLYNTVSLIVMLFTPIASYSALEWRMQ